MADKYTEGYDAKPLKPLYSGVGEVLSTVVARAEIAAADDDGQLYVLARGIPLDATLVAINLPIGYTAITAGTDYDIGVYKNTGTYASPTWTAQDADIFVDGYNFSAGASTPLGILESATDSTIAELLSLNTEKAMSEYAIVLTANTVGSAAQDLEFHLVFAPAH